MKKKTTLTKMHIAPSTVRYDAVAARDSNEVGQILAGTRKRNGYSLVTFSELLHTITANIYPELGTSRNATGRHLYLLEHFTLKKSS